MWQAKTHSRFASSSESSLANHHSENWPAKLLESSWSDHVDHPGRWTGNLKMMIWKMIFFFNWAGFWGSSRWSSGVYKNEDGTPCEATCFFRAQLKGVDEVTSLLRDPPLSMWTPSCFHEMACIPTRTSLKLCMLTVYFKAFRFTINMQWKGINMFIIIHHQHQSSSSPLWIMIMIMIIMMLIIISHSSHIFLENQKLGLRLGDPRLSTAGTNIFQWAFTTAQSRHPNHGLFDDGSTTQTKVKD